LARNPISAPIYPSNPMMKLRGRCRRRRHLTNRPGHHDRHRSSSWS